MRKRSKILLLVAAIFWAVEVLPLTRFGLHLLSHMPISTPPDPGDAEEKAIALAVLWMFFGIAGLGVSAVTCFFCVVDWLDFKKSAASRGSEASS